MQEQAIYFHTHLAHNVLHDENLGDGDDGDDDTKMFHTVLAA